MKEKVIEVAGKTWKTLGEKGELNLTQLPKTVQEEEAIVYQALGWLAREDKINYSVKNKQTFVSLVESELRAFKNTIQNAKRQANTTSPSATSMLTAGRKRAGV